MYISWSSGPSSVKQELQESLWTDYNFQLKNWTLCTDVSRDWRSKDGLMTILKQYIQK